MQIGDIYHWDTCPYNKHYVCILGVGKFDIYSGGNIVKFAMISSKQTLHPNRLFLPKGSTLCLKKESYLKMDGPNIFTHAESTFKDLISLNYMKYEGKLNKKCVKEIKEIIYQDRDVFSPYEKDIFRKVYLGK